ncbi:MAG TPA: PQQ-binding-like beta-propeller repeat protein [Kiritimatiellia bacterium]|nr:PQQ-binding-like beta-propeller repeat protein [Kiritimatiellia bacterium]HMO99207.1 PQQ-binding-like beta-propeller repeat protein [Kiritimatiellia bacterium]
MTRALPIIGFISVMFTFPLVADWPQFQCDSGNRGYQAAERIATVNRHVFTTPQGGYGGESWGFTNRYLAGQPVVAGGVVVVASMTGRVFALSETTGAMAWSVDVGGPVLNSCAIRDGRVIVATQAGTLTALHALDGAVLWTYRAGRHGFAAAPVVDDGVVYIGDKAGRFHAVNAATGQALWVFETGGASDTGAVRATILCTAAVLGDGVFFGAENMHAYGLDRATGARLWRRAVTGQSFVHGDPVGSNDERAGITVAAGWAVTSAQNGGVVIFRTQPVYAPHWMLDQGELLIENATGTNWTGNPLGNTNAWIIEQRAISGALATNPHLRTFWALHPATGADKFAQPMPILWTGGSGGSAAAPVVDDAGGRAWVMARSVYARIDGGHMVRAYGDLVKLNLNFDPAIYTNTAQGALGFTYFACTNPAACSIGFGDVHKVSDEGEILTGAQNAIMTSTWVSNGGWDVENERTFNVRFYSSDDLGGAPLYGGAVGVVVANGRVIVRDTSGVKSYVAAE